MKDLITKALGFASKAAAPLLPYLTKILVSVILCLFVLLTLQTCRIGHLQQEIGAQGAEIDECVRANETNQTTIQQLRDTAEANERQYDHAIERARVAAERADSLQVQIDRTAEEDIHVIESTDDACGLAPMPDDVRLRLNARSN